MNYIKRNNNYIIVDGKEIEISLIGFLNSLLIKTFKDYISTEKNTRKVLKIYKNIPIYVSNKILLAQTSGLRTNHYLAFNYYEIKEIDIKSKYTIITFYDNTTILINITKERIRYVLKNARIVDEYITLNN